MSIIFDDQPVKFAIKTILAAASSTHHKRKVGGDFGECNRLFLRVIQK